MNALQTIPESYNENYNYNSFVPSLFIFAIGLIIFCKDIYESTKISKTLQAFEQKVMNIQETNIQNMSAQLKNLSELCERSIVQNIGSYDRTSELASNISETNSKFEDLSKQISTIPASINKLITNNTTELADNISRTHSQISEIHAVRSLDNIEQGVYQSWSGTGEYFQEGRFKFTAEIKIVNKHQKTYRQNKMWMEEDDIASVAYRDSLLLAFKRFSSINSDCKSKNHGPLTGFMAEDFNTPNLEHINTIKSINGWFRTPHNTPTKRYMNCVKYDWDGSIEISIVLTQIYNNGYDCMDTMLRDTEINWKKYLVPTL